MIIAMQELSEIYSDHLWLEFSTQERDLGWEQAKQNSERAYYNAYLNRLCLNAVLAWLAEENKESGLETASVWLEDSLPTIWEVTKGTAINIGETRLVLIPSEADNISELCVPQEWVDIPEWVADYYLGVQINPEDCWIRIWGYTTHKQLKEESEYNYLDRTYSLLRNELVEDIYVMLAVREFHPVTRVQIASLPVLSATEAESLIAGLGQPTVYSPRLDVPFGRWGALLANAQWREQLYQKRCSEVVAVAETTSQAISSLKEKTNEEKKVLGEKLLKRCKREGYDWVDLDRISQIINEVQQTLLKGREAIESAFIELLNPDFSSSLAGATKGEDDDEEEEGDWDDEENWDEEIKDFSQSLAEELIEFYEIDE